MERQVYLVEVCFRDYVPAKEKIVGYVEVMATNETYALYLGSAEYLRLIRSSPVHMRQYYKYANSEDDYYVSDAVLFE